MVSLKFWDANIVGAWSRGMSSSSPRPLLRPFRWQRRTSVPPVVPFAPLATSPTAAVAAALEPIPLQPQPPLPVAPAAPVVPVAVVDSWDARLRAARKAALPLQLKLAVCP